MKVRVEQGHELGRRLLGHFRQKVTVIWTRMVVVEVEACSLYSGVSDVRERKNYMKTTLSSRS